MSSAVRVRFSAHEDRLEVLGLGGVYRAGDGDTFFGPLDLLRNASLASCRLALIRSNKWTGWQSGITWSDEGGGSFDEDASAAAPAVLVVNGDGSLVLEVTLYGINRSSIGADSIRRLLDPLLQRRRATLASLEEAETDPGPSWELTIIPAIRGATVGHVATLTDDLVALADAAAGGAVTRETALDLIRGGRGELLVGLEESGWLEAKSSGYVLDERGKVELAQDVARFANSETGGLLVLGLRTKRRMDTDVIVGLAPLHDPPSIQRYHKVLDHRIFPAVDGLEIVAGPLPHLSGHHLLVVRVPPQPEELKPFLVHGAVVGRRVEGAYISIVRRRGEHSIAVDPAAIHAQIAAGRALLRARPDQRS